MAWYLSAGSNCLMKLMWFWICLSALGMFAVGELVL